MEGAYLDGEIGKEATTGAVKAAISLIPGVGPFLVEAFFDTPGRLAEKRRDEHIDAILKHLVQVQESLIDIDYLQSEDFTDVPSILIIKSLRNCIASSLLLIEAIKWCE
jgi:hypothetical protein